MKRVLQLSSLFLGLALSAVAQAQALDVNVSDSALRVELSGPLTSLHAQYAIGGLTAKHDHRVTQGHATLLVTGDAGARDANVTAGLGVRAVVLSGNDHNDIKVNGGALGLGGMADARVPAFNRIGGGAYLYWAPKVASFGDLNGHLEYAVNGSYQILRQATLYLGYRQVRLRADSQNFTADSGFHLGVKLEF